MPLYLSFDKLWNAYAKLLIDVGHSPCDQNWPNQCAIRMSIVLIGTGTDFSKYTDPKCKHGHARGAESLANWLWKNHGAPKVHPTPAGAKKALKDKQGIIFFKDCFTRDGETVRSGDHIDLWRRGKFQTYDDPENRSSQVWFWAVK